ncbi:major facilitator superfamily domain-containing protein [Aspergillus pseudotamarii]|uniref:Major facilitator superfamily domain-containing protein n=1 Tax=Aspergillus pseudotamarii TaxID=132259 RepID=A0A5N6SD76_ASPPS|nr:major facilitator superfamily domain-containing protein [Aspergillus pseudotamarii]KAE8131064.1 major facilitator superfamily domain-containing protein [Aspergillus pseudotamarii]
MQDCQRNAVSPETNPNPPTYRTSITRSTSGTDENDYPEGGLRAWLVVVGGWFGLFSTFGLINSMGTLQAYVENHQLKDYSIGTTGWTFGMYAFLTFFCGAQIGPIFDTKGPRLLVIVGSMLVMVMTVTLGFCQEYWHFMLSIGVAGGLAASLILTPSVSAIGHFFNKNRGIATGIATTGGSAGGIVFPLVLEKLFPIIGWAWATRVVALICLVTIILTNLLIRSRLPKKPASHMLPDLRIFRDPKFTITTIGVFFIELGLFIPMSYISSYGLAHGVSRELSYQLLAILNAGSFFGRIIPGYFADVWGRYNTLTCMVILCFVSNACLWLPGGHKTPVLIIYCLVFGFASGSNISLTPVCISQLCKVENYGMYYASSYTIVSFGTLIGIPVAGEILARCNGEYWGLITFVICCYAVGIICCITVRIIHLGWRRCWAMY